MSGRGGRKRGRPPKTPNERVVGKFNYQLLKKPKYLSKNCDSQESTPSVSRATSPQESDGSRSIQRKSFGKPRSGRGRKPGTGNSYSTRKGYESEYHYGSDFGDSSDNKSDMDDDMIFSPSDDESLVKSDTESEFSVCSFSQSLIGRPPRPPSPEPIWLQGREYPPLELPESSEDLLIDINLVFPALGVYEVLRRFRHLVRLSPFRFEDFCAALTCEEQSVLLADVHIMLLKAILREEDVQGTHFGPLDQKDSVNISLYLIDPITWPEILRSYVESDRLLADSTVLEILSEREYPYCGVKDRITVLQFLTDQFLTTNTVRDVLLQEGPIHYDDHCRVCHRLGKLLCCETCPAVYHLECVDPPLIDVPTEDWQCNLCKSHKVTGVVDCVLLQEKQGILVRHDQIGLDRHGRKFWFVARRIFVEDQNGRSTWYYSTTSKFELLMNMIDKNDLEAGLYNKLMDRKDEIIRQLKLTEQITNEFKQNKKSYIDFENECVNGLNDSNSSEKEKSAASNQVLTRQKKSQIDNNTQYFKLGMDNAFKSYVNQYGSNPVALNKPQRNEERDKRRHLSHKFSLTAASEFKWSGSTMGTMDNVITVLRNTIISFEQRIAPPFMNPNWNHIKKLWSTAVTNCRHAKEFASVLYLYQASLKYVVFANVWHEQLGHLSLQRITSAEREERKKLEKREKRERDEEEERNRLSVNYIKYSLGLKHQVWKQRGEEFRVHGQWGWMWLSSARRCLVGSKRRGVTQAIPPYKISIHYTSTKLNEVIAVDPRTIKYLNNLEFCKQNDLYCKNLRKFQDLELHPLNDMLKDVDTIDVSKAFTTPGRLLYPKIARKSYLDNFLERREKLKKIEEWVGNNSSNNAEQIPSNLLNFSEETNYSKPFLERQMFNLIENFKPQHFGSGNNINLDIVKFLAKKIQTVRYQFSQLNRFAKQYKCYTKECNTNSNAVSQITQNTCYSPLCLQKARAKKNLLILLRRAHTAGNGSKETVDAILGAVKKPSILEQKLTENRKEYYSSNDDGDEYKWEEETPYDIIVDWEQARNSAVPYDDALLKSCYTPTDNLMDFVVSKEEKPDKNSFFNFDDTGMNDEKVEFMENMEVSSNVEVSCENTNDATVEGIPLHNNDIDDFSNKRRKLQKNRNKSVGMAAKEVVPLHELEQKPARQNRRFPLHTKNSKREEIKLEKEFFLNGKQKLFSTKSTAGRIYLYRNANEIIIKKDPDNEEASNKIETFTKYPLVSNYVTHKGGPNILVLPRYELMKLARNAGKTPVSGFNHLAKPSFVWPYPCSRPLFKTCWAYRTSKASSLSCVALQLRILWCCLRWDDMAAKPPSTDGKHQITTENEIVTLELLKFKNGGRYGECTKYLRRKVTVPLEMPKTIREVTSIRSGLRKRKRAESPQPAEPQTTEEWLEEEKLELWEIKYMGEKQEKVKFTPVTRSATLRHTDGSSNASSTSQENGVSRAKAQEDLKEKVDQTKVQRFVNPKKLAEGVKLPQLKASPAVGRKVIVKNPDGTTRIIQHPVVPSKASTTTATVIASAPSTTLVKPQSSGQPHKVQIIRGPDGKVSVRGLNPGQQLIQMPDGKLHILTTSSANSQGTPVNKIKVAVKSNTTPTSVQKSNQATRTIMSNEARKESTSVGTQKVVQRILNNAANQSNGQRTVSSVQGSPTIATIASKATQNNPQATSTQITPKLLVNANTNSPKLFVANPDSQATAVQQPKLSTLSNAGFVQQGKPIQNNVLPIANAAAPPTQKVIQQIVNTSNVQQQIMVGGQRIILSPGQTIVTQRSISAASYSTLAQQNAQQISSTSEVSTTPQKIVKQFTTSSPQTPTAATSIPQTSSIASNPPILSNNSQQIVVQNSTLAQQLAQGKLQVATINGQQVIIKPLGNNQAQIVAHIKTQSDAGITQTPSSTATNSTQSSSYQNTTDCQTSEIPQPTSTTAPPPQPAQTFQQPSIEESLLQGQPPGTVIKCVTAQVVQTGQGPRIVLQGLVGNDFTQEQLALVEQKVKQQLLKAQESSGKQSYLGPTKIYLAVQPPNSSLNSQPPPLTPVNQSSSQQLVLERHTETLKNNILKKRFMLENNLQSEIKDEVKSNMMSNVSHPTLLEPLKTSNAKNVVSDTKKQECQENNVKFGRESQPIRNKKVGKKREKLYCICRTPYDDTKFYVGCDLCSNWFHGDCVNITEEASKNLSEYICDECKNVRGTEQLYCSCRQPYDETQFYICCDKCQDWFHGKCVGILQSEAEFIDEYICPDCNKHGALDTENLTDLCSDGKDELKLLIKQIQSHKSAWPFMEPVDPEEAPDYYNVIKEPMDLKKIEDKINSESYQKLSDFISDMTKIFDNCRYYNQKDSAFYKCAEILESYFVQKIKNFRKNNVNSQNNQES